jgi:exodeoxyribonuclease VII large subunit
MRRTLGSLRQSFAERASGLHALSPLAVLARGYAIATSVEGRAIRDAREVAPGDRLTVRVHRGSIEVDVAASHPAPEPEAGETS